MLGAFLFEAFRVIAVFKEKKHPSTLDWIVSAFFVLLGALVPLFYGVKERNFLEVAQLGLSVPGLITGGFRVATAGAPKPDPAAPVEKADVVAKRRNYIALRPSR